jgi:ATP-dependent protease ClpP protease subunit
MALRAFLLSLALVGCAPSLKNLDVRGEAGPVDALVKTAYIGEVDADSLDAAAMVLMESPPVVNLIIDSPGGSVRVGLVFVDLMRAAQANGTHIRCVVNGMAASMGAYILQACDQRLMTKQSAVMFHTVSVSGIEGTQYDLERVTEYLETLNHRLAIFIAGRLKISLADYEARVHDRDWWLGYEEALAVGAVDAVL